MFSEDSERDLGGGQHPEKRKPPPFNWKANSVGDLIAWRDQITECLPPLSINEMNLEEEMLLQFHSLRQLQNDVMNDDSLPLNQRAQVANATTNSLEKLMTRQQDIYTSERFKAVERLLIRSLSKLPEDLAAKFLESYEKILEAV